LLQEAAFDFGDAYLGSTLRQTLTLSNSTPVKAMLMCDMTAHSEFQLVLPRQAWKPEVRREGHYSIAVVKERMWPVGFPLQYYASQTQMQTAGLCMGSALPLSGASRGWTYHTNMGGMGTSVLSTATSLSPARACSEVAALHAPLQHYNAW
jgi:hypothetical protein